MRNVIACCFFFGFFCNDDESARAYHWPSLSIPLWIQEGVAGVFANGED